MAGNNSEPLTDELFSSNVAFLRENVDHMFVLLMGTIICFLQAGFGMLEAGSVRSKNTTNILVKNFGDLCLGVVAFFVVGYALAFSDGNEWVGDQYFGLVGLPDSLLPHVFMQATFAATCMTIVSGATAERMDYAGYLLTSVLVTGVVYPIATHWSWTGLGWLAQEGFTDFAGSAVVHLAGAVLSLPGCVILGARTDRWTKAGGIPGHSIPFVCLGFLILDFGFLAFNGGSQGSISNAGDGEAFSRAVVNTQMACGTAGIVGLFIYKVFSGSYSLIRSVNCSIAGMVSLCAGCNLFAPWASCVVAAIGAAAYLLVSGLMVALRIDDPVDAIAVHGAGGIVGILAVPVFMEGGFIEGYSDAAMETLRINAIGAGAISAYNFSIGIVLFGILRLAGRLRKDKATEKMGSDWIHHGEESYPEAAWLQLEVLIIAQRGLTCYDIKNNYD